MQIEIVVGHSVSRQLLALNIASTERTSPARAIFRFQRDSPESSVDRREPRHSGPHRQTEP